MTRASRRRRGGLALIAAAGIALAAVLAYVLNVPGEPSGEEDTGAGTTARAEAPSAALIERGAYLARAGNCIGCHTAAGGAPLAGGRGIETPFGVVFSSNLTADPRTGIGSWSSGDFWRALHHGRSKDGRLLYPAFPYPNFTHVTRADSDALYAYLRSTPPVAQANRTHALRFPYSTQAALAVWRALYFRPTPLSEEPARSPEWHRGRYLVEGLGHCAACHSSRNMLGGTGRNGEFAGGLMPDAGWYAPSLATPAEGGVHGWPAAEVVRLLKAGVSPHATVSGPMAEVVYASTQHLTDADLGAMAVYLAAIPVTAHEAVQPKAADRETLARGAKVYDQHCAACHGDQGQGAGGLYPRLAGNRAVTLPLHNNVVQMIRWGGFSPATSANPRPFGMPPFGQILPDEDVAAVATYIRQSWGNAASPVTPLDVLRVP